MSVSKASILWMHRRCSRRVSCAERPLEKHAIIRNLLLAGDCCACRSGWRAGIPWRYAEHGRLPGRPSIVQQCHRCVTKLPNWRLQWLSLNIASSGAKRSWQWPWRSAACTAGSVERLWRCVKGTVTWTGRHRSGLCRWLLLCLNLRVLLRVLLTRIRHGSPRTTLSLRIGSRLHSR